jgi:hypothetical protein
MTREEFLANNEERLQLMDAATYNKAVKDLKKLDNATWIETYAPAFMEAGVNTGDMAALKKTAEPLPKRLREAFGDLKFAPSEKWKNRVYKQEFSDVDKDKFEEGLSKMKSYYDQEVAQRKADADKEKRKREVKNWGWRDFIASDYEKQRYLEDPQAALFGEQAPELGKAPSTRWDAGTDLGLGAAAAVADLSPARLAIAIGPGLRLARDVKHNVTDSPYQKKWRNIFTGFGTDVALNAATYGLPNYRRTQRIMDKVLPEVPANVVAKEAMEAESKAIMAGAEMVMPAISERSSLTEDAKRALFLKAVNEMPESQMKKELSALAGDVNIDWARADAIVRNNLGSAGMAATPELREKSRAVLLNRDESTPLWKFADEAPNPEKPSTAHMWTDPNTGVTKPIMARQKYDPLTRKMLETSEPTAKDLKDAATRRAWEKNFARFSPGVANTAPTVTGQRERLKGSVDVFETPEERETIEAIKAQEERFWKAGFKPHKDNSLMYKAWKEYADEHGWEVDD